ncbi:MAG TPA: MFS transporter [Dissulfurispiraceae bacterium]|nr:MFS transporter [Dissulfurispiraceae bacterium]
MQTVKSPLPFHYSWVIVATGMLCIFACLGLGRFALGMLLPSMAASLNLTYSQMGFISTANFIGYLIAVLASGTWALRIGPRLLIAAALVIVGSSMMLVSRATDFIGALALYFATGIGSGATNVPVMALVSHWFASHVRGRAAGFIVIGSGFAIMLTGMLVPYINGELGSEGWRMSWRILGAIVLAVALIGWKLIRGNPSEKGLARFGDEGTPAANPRMPVPPSAASVYREGILYHLGAIYFLFGFTYVIYVTFIVTVLVNERGFSEGAAGLFWAWIGFLSVFSGPVFGTLSDRIGRKAGLILVFAMQAAAYLLVATNLPGIFLYLSIGLFGVVAWSIPSIMAAAVADYMGSQRAGQAFGFVTFIFGFGQISGPAAAGLLAETTGSFSHSFALAAALAGVAMVLSSFMRKPRR